MSTGTRISILEAGPIAWALADALAPACERIEVAGSIRRGRPDVGDIELLAVPKTHEAPVEPSGFFDAPEPIVVNDLVERVYALREAGVLAEVEQHKAAGRRYVKSVHVESGLQVDLFMVRPPASWGVLYLIRTGPATYSQWFVTEARRRAMHVGAAQLHRGGLGCGAIPCDVIPTPEEQDVYAALSLPWVRPEDRS